MESDLDQMTSEELIAEVKKLRGGIRKHRDSSLHELCWHHPELWGLLPEKTDPIPVVPEWPEFIKGCVRYRQSLDEQVPNALRSSEPYESAREKGLDSLLKHSNVATRLPVQDLARARLFYAEKLGLQSNRRPRWRRDAFAVRLSSLFIDNIGHLEIFGSCGGAHSQVPFIEGVGLCRLFLCDVGSGVFTCSIGSLGECNISVFVITDSDLGIAVFQTRR